MSLKEILSEELLTRLKIYYRIMLLKLSGSGSYRCTTIGNFF